MVCNDEGVTVLLNDHNTTIESQEQLFKKIYGHLREIAFMKLRNESQSSTYNVTALVDDAFIRIMSGSDYKWENRRQFYASVATTMKRILIEHARHNLKKDRQQKFYAVEFQEEIHLDDEASRQLVNLNDAIDTLVSKKPELGEIVQLKFFIGLSIEEIADLMDCSARSIDRKWSMARAWLYSEMAA